MTDSCFIKKEIYIGLLVHSLNFYGNANTTNVWLPSASKAEVRKHSSFKCQQPEKVGDSGPKGHLHISVWTGVFIRRKNESRTKNSGGVELEVLYV